MKQANPYAEPRSREVVKFGGSTIIKNKGPIRRRLMIGVPTLGNVRIEWDVHRRGMSIPINWSMGEVTASHIPDAIGIGYHTADAQNVCMERAYLDKYEWCLLYEDDVLPPFDAFLRLSVHMEKLRAPIVSGLYYSKSEPCWPLTFRGRGNGAFRGYATGDSRPGVGHKVWCDGVPTGFFLIHSSIFRYLWQNSEDYRAPDGHKIKRVFQFPRESWWDPEQDRYFSQMGTSDLALCDRIMKENIFWKTGWRDLSKKKYPFLVDAGIFCQQIDPNGKLYPNMCHEVLPPLGDLPESEQNGGPVKVKKRKKKR